MKITNLKLTNFKNYSDETFVFNPKYNAIVGFNGMGKTNLLDAIYFTCMTKSNFVINDSNIIKQKEKFLRTQAQLEEANEIYKITCKFEKRKKKIFEFNGKAYDKLADHIGKFPVVFIVPSDQNLILDGSKQRRQLIDNTLSQLDRNYLYNLINYNSLLNQRNAYLKLAGKSSSFQSSLAMTYSEQMVKPTEYIYKKRKLFIDEFSKVFTEKYRLISNNQEKSTCFYLSQLNENDFLIFSKENLEKDRIIGRTSVGIHKDDLVFEMDDKSVKYFASQGQTKSFVLSIKLTQYEIIAANSGIKPLLLLDDLFDKLDHKRVKQLIELLETENIDQVFISDTDTNRIVNILQKMNVDYKKIVIQDGNQKHIRNASEEE